MKYFTYPLSGMRKEAKSYASLLRTAVDMVGPNNQFKTLEDAVATVNRTYHKQFARAAERYSRGGRRKVPLKALDPFSQPTQPFYPREVDPFGFKYTPEQYKRALEGRSAFIADGSHTFAQAPGARMNYKVSPMIDPSRGDLTGEVSRVLSRDTAIRRK